MSSESLTTQFQDWVVSEMNQSGVDDRVALRGDYLFVVDNQPAFIFTIDSKRVQSFEWGQSQIKEIFSDAQLTALLEGAYRTKIETDSKTLTMILRGTIRAKHAFVSGKVVISGDLPAFMNLTSLLKSRGIRPLTAN